MKYRRQGPTIFDEHKERKILALYNEGYPKDWISRKYNVSHKGIDNILEYYTDKEDKLILEAQEAWGEPEGLYE